MSWVMAAILSICGILSILLLAYLSGRNFALGVLHQVVDIVKKVEKITVQTVQTDQTGQTVQTDQTDQTGQTGQMNNERRTNEKK